MTFEKEMAKYKQAARDLEMVKISAAIFNNVVRNNMNQMLVLRYEASRSLRINDDALTSFNNELHEITTFLNNMENLETFSEKKDAFWQCDQ